MRQPLPVAHLGTFNVTFHMYSVLSDLQPAVQTPGDGDALAGLARAAQRLLQSLQRALG